MLKSTQNDKCTGEVEFAAIIYFLSYDESTRNGHQKYVMCTHKNRVTVVPYEK